MDGRSEGCICELFTYLPNLGVYPNSSHITELCAIGRKGVDGHE